MNTNFLFFGQSAISANTLSSQLRREPQRMVKDEVVVKPPRDPYSELRQASQRLSEGKSVFASSSLAPEKAEK